MLCGVVRGEGLRREKTVAMLTFALFLQLACLLLPSMAYQLNAFASMSRALQTSKSELSTCLQQSELSSSPKKTKKVEIVFKEDGNKFLDLSGVPDLLKLRSGLTTYLYLRDWYDDLFEDISSCVSQDIPGKSKTIAILGTEDIGKSALFLVILKKLLDDPSTLGLTTRSFYYQTRPNTEEIWLYRHVRANEFSLTRAIQDLPLDENIPLFVDMETMDGSPNGHLGVSLIFTAFRLSHFKQLTKNGWRKVMPTWSAEEQADFFNSKQFEREYGKEAALRAYDNMHFFGGAIRDNIQFAISKERNPKGELEPVIQDKGELVCDRFFKFGSGNPAVADALVHRNPHVVNGKYKFGKMPYVYSFASPFVLRSLLQLKNNMLVTHVRNKYNTDTYRGHDKDGGEFELLCIHGFKISGVEFEAQPLTDGTQATRVTFPPKEVLALNWREQKNYLQPNLLYIPPYGNLESGDAFCLMKIDERWTLVILQCTISETHPVKQNGVKIIHDCYSSNSELAVDETVIMFMTPLNGKLTTKQSLVTQKTGEGLEEAQQVTVIVSAQYKIENELVSDDDIAA